MNRKKLYLLLLHSCTTSTLIQAQRNSIYVELLGNTGYGALGYERVIGDYRSWKWDMVFGIGTYNLRDFHHNFNPDLAIPFLQKLSYKLHVKHHIFVASGIMWNSFIDADREFKARRHNHLHWNTNAGYSFNIRHNWQLQCYYIWY